MDNVYQRENYLKKIRGFYKSADIIKVITGIRRAGKSYLLKSIINELKSNGIEEKDIIYIELDRKEYLDITKYKQLEKLIDSKINDKDFKYLFIDEIENVKGFEKLINAYREEGNISVFITGSNSYLLSGELVTKLTGRFVEIEVFPLNFYEYVDMKNFLGKEIEENIYKEFEKYIREGGFPGSLLLDSYEDKTLYVSNIMKQIFEKDIKSKNKIKDTKLFEVVEKYIINNYGAIISVKSIINYLNGQNIKTDRRTIKRYIDLLKNAKIIYECDLFDMKSKIVLKSEKKYYLADISIYFSLNTDNTLNYGGILENILHNYLLSKDYSLSVGKIGKLEMDFIAREGRDNYYYIQVSKNVDNDKTKIREYKPFYEIKSLYPRYLFLLDMILQENIDGIKNVNIVDFIYNNKELK